jgi:hypothetical protein
MVATQVPTIAKLKCLVREVGIRRAVYPKRVAEGKMDQRAAVYEIEVMEAILADYQKRARDESTQSGTER